MTTTPQLDIKVIYSSSKRRSRGRWTSGSSASMRSSRLVLLGLLNLIAAGAMYYGTWWQADPRVRIKVFIHTPLPGVDLDQTAKMLIPRRPGALDAETPPIAEVDPDSSTGPVAGRETDIQTARATKFVGTAIGWEVLATLAVCALALSGGAILGHAGGTHLRLGSAVVGLVGLGVVGWQAYALMIQYGRFVPDQLRVDVCGAVLILALVGLALARSACLLTYVAAVALVLSAIGSVVGLYVGAQFDAIKPAELPMPFLPFLALVFVVQSLWGWILLPLASRIRH